MYTLLTSLGWNPKRILDIGAYKGTWTKDTRRVFPNADYTLIEPNSHKELRGEHVLYELLSSSESEVEWFSNGTTGDSIFQEQTSYYKNIPPIIRKTTTLDILFPNKSFDFIKIDCQGAELEILKGGQQLVSTADVLLLECPFAGCYNKDAPTFLDYISYVDSIGFSPLHITEQHHANNVLIQIDILFLRKTSPLWNFIQQRIG
jgi:FkbM family methyltransferase